MTLRSRMRRGERVRVHGAERIGPLLGAATGIPGLPLKRVLGSRDIT
jgi:hypothetical protein